MRSFEKLSLVLLFVAFREHVRAQTTTALYIPSLLDSGGLNPGAFLQASLVGTQDGTSVYQLILGSNDDQEDDGPDPTLTLSEASSTAHMFGSVVDDGVTVSLDIQCSINGDTSTCTEADIAISGTVSTSSLSTFTESVSSVPVTLLSALPGASATSNIAQPTSSPSGSSGSAGNSASSSSGSSVGNPSVPAPSGGSSPAPVPSPTGSANSSSPTTLNPPNSANPRVMSMSILALPLVILSVLL